ADETGRPAVVGAELGEIVRGSCRSGPGVDLAATLEACSELLLRHGGHAGAAGFEVRLDDWDRFHDGFLALVASAIDPDPRRQLRVDLALPARSVDYGLVRDFAR